MKTDNCLDCPHHKEDYDPTPDYDDIFNMNNRYCACSLTPNKNINLDSEHTVDRQPFRIVTRGVRPYRLRKCSPVPKWCPLIPKKVKKRNYHKKKGRSSN